jgi:hypothetical protein
MTPRPALAAAFCLLLLVPTACARQPVPRPEIRADPVELGGASRVGELRLLGAWTLTATTPEFGGISAAVPEGDRLWLLSDRCRLFELTWRQPPPDRPAKLPILAQRELAHADGRPLDSEAMLLLPGGGLVVADEGCGCLVSFAAGAARPSGPPRPVAGLGGGGGELNQGIEALAGLPDGALLAIGEAEDGGADRHRAVTMSGRDARTRYYRAAPGFRPTDAAVSGPYLFVLERRVSLLGGWQSRLVALPRERLDSEDSLAGRELAILSGPRIGENHEALAVLRDGGAGYRFLIVADDNFSPLQRTLLVALDWQPG